MSFVIELLDSRFMMDYMEIYRILNKINGKSYVGQTANSFKQRYGGDGAWWRATNNILLKRAAKKYGKENFEVSILEDKISSLTELDEREIYWIRRFNTISPNGYNFLAGGERSIGVCHHERSRAKMSLSQRKRNFGNYKFRNNREGKIYECLNLSEFCRNKGLPCTLMVHLASGKKHRYKEWTRAEDYLKEWNFVSPNGKTYRVLEGELRPFCKEHGLHHSAIYSMIKYGYQSHKGWRIS